MRSASDAIITTFEADQSLVARDLKDAFEDVLSKFHQAHVIPYAPFPAHERPTIELLIGYSRDHKSGLWVSDLDVLSPVSFYRAIGIAQAHAMSILETLYRLPLLSIPSAVALASYVLFRIKGSNIYCGNSTDIFVVGDLAAQWVNRTRTKALEDVWEQYARNVEAASMRTFFGEPLTDLKPTSELQQAFQHVMADVKRDLSVVLRRQP
jgi:hypothetical protein